MRTNAFRLILFFSTMSFAATALAGPQSLLLEVGSDTNISHGDSDLPGDGKEFEFSLHLQKGYSVGVRGELYTQQANQSGRNSLRDTGDAGVQLGYEADKSVLRWGTAIEAGMVNGVALQDWYGVHSDISSGDSSRTSPPTSGEEAYAQTSFFVGHTFALLDSSWMETGFAAFAYANLGTLMINSGAEGGWYIGSKGLSKDFRPRLAGSPIPEQIKGAVLSIHLEDREIAYDLRSQSVGTRPNQIWLVYAMDTPLILDLHLNAEFRQALTPEVTDPLTANEHPVSRVRAGIGLIF